MKLQGLAAIPLLLMGGCATILGGTTQVVAVDSNPSGATCQASRDGLALHSGVTPMSFPVDKSYRSITVSCVDPMNRRGTAIDRPGLEPWVFGNIILGGLVGITVDLMSSSINKYDTAVNVDMVGQSAPGAAPVPLAASPVAPMVVSTSSPMALAPVQVPPRRDLMVRVASDDSRGVVLLDVIAGGAGAAAGLQAGDTIVRFNGVRIVATGDLQRELAVVRANSQVIAAVWRDDREMPVRIRF